MLLLKSYVKETSPFPPLKKVSLTGQVCALAVGVNVRQHLGICWQRFKRSNGPSPQGYTSRAQNFLLSMHRYGRSFLLSTGFFFQRLSIRTDHYTCICLSCSLRTLAQCKRLEESNTLFVVKIQFFLLDFVVLFPFLYRQTGHWVCRSDFEI